MIMPISTANDILAMKEKTLIPKGLMADVIRDSKVEGSTAWAGDAMTISNTPQQGINWVGNPPNVTAVIVKSNSSRYANDGWIDGSEKHYRYSFKARKGQINLFELANAVLLNQPRFGYPINLFTSSGSNWLYRGIFRVKSIETSSVILSRQSKRSMQRAFEVGMEEPIFYEGDRKYVLHRVAERSTTAISLAKSANSQKCDICCMDFRQRYGLAYIEAHHKVPLASIPSNHALKPSDLVLLCANCHRAVHLYMRQGKESYSYIRKTLRRRMDINSKD